MKNVFLLLALLSFCLAACVPNRKLVIAQDKTLHRPQDKTYEHPLPLVKEEFTIQSGDILSVDITCIDPIGASYFQHAHGEPRGSNPSLDGYEVNDSGSVLIPLLGSIHVAGLALPQAEALIRKAALKHYAKPTVRLTLLNNSITVLGEVMNPGTFVLHHTGHSVFEAIGTAGGLTTMADLREVKVIRNRGDSASVYFIDLGDECLLTTPQYLVMPGDVIYIKPLKRKMFTFQESQQVFRGLSVMLAVASLIVAISKT